jgi:tetratricopeptide (TPR) repeat protein
LLQAASLKLQAEILEEKAPEAAIQTYDRIVAIKDLPAEQTRQAVLKGVDLAAAQNLLANAIDRLRNYVLSTNSAGDPALDLLRLTLGELHLKRYYQLASGRTNQTQPTPADKNLVQQALTQFDFLIKTHTNSPLVGKAHLNRGWCLWEEARVPGGEGRLPECLAAFQLATERLTNSEDQAVARFKWADCQFLQKNFSNALQNYRILLTSYEGSPSVKAKWFDQALYQIIRASLEIKDLSGARAALDRILAEFASSPIAEQAMVLFGQALLEAGDPGGGRKIFTDFRERFPNSALQERRGWASAGASHKKPIGLQPSGTATGSTLTPTTPPAANRIRFGSGHLQVRQQNERARALHGAGRAFSR